MVDIVNPSTPVGTITSSGELAGLAVVDNPKIDVGFETDSQGVTVSSKTIGAGTRAVKISFYENDNDGAATDQASRLLFVSFNAPDGGEQAAVNTVATRRIIPINTDKEFEFPVGGECTKISYRADVAVAANSSTKVFGGYTL